VWRKDLSGESLGESSPALVDVDRNGSLDVMIGTHAGKVWAFSGGTGNVVAGWPQATGTKVDSTVSSADVTGDGRHELFVGSGSYGNYHGAMYSFGLNGALRFRAAFSEPDAIYGGPVKGSAALGDINSDGVIDATYGMLSVHSLRSLRATDGAQNGGGEFFNWEDSIHGSPALADVNRDGSLDVVMGGDSAALGIVDHSGGMVRAISGNGQPIWTHYVNDIVRGSIAVGDITGDGRVEVVHGGGDFYHRSDSRRIYALDGATGAEKWSRELDGVTNASPTLADLNGDGRLDVAIGTWNSVAQWWLTGGTVYAFDGVTGNQLPGFPKVRGAGEVVLGGITTADINADGGQDLFVPTYSGITVFSGKTGQSLLQLAQGDNVGFENSPAIADVDGDGQLDVLAAGRHANGTAVVYRWELSANAKLGSKGWHQFQKDSRHTGSWTSKTMNAQALAHNRIAGTDRYDTAAKLSSGATTNGTVYVATARSFADAVAAAPAAAADDAPVLLVDRDAIPDRTLQRLQVLAPDRIVVLGGTGAISDAVLAQLGTLATNGATRRAGPDREATSAAISSQAFAPGVPVAYVVWGRSFPEGVAAAAAGAFRGGPVLLVDGTSISAPVAAELDRLNPQSIVVVGGTNFVSDGVFQSLSSYSGNVTRIAANDRDATVAALSKATYPAGGTRPYVVTGLKFPDALAAGAAPNRNGAPLLMVPGACMPNVVRTELNRLGATGLTLIGGTSVLSGAVASLTPCS
jgi:putative cell wall-binding protein